jgi:peptidyl-prolyl cis-trans isomerase SurA
MKKIVYSIFMIATSIIALSVSAQKNNGDAELFTYGGKSVSKSEFLRMYTKNINNQKPDFSEQALRDYLQLYARFKMKVAEAVKLKMDTLPNIQNELGGYKKQLAKTYLTDKEVTDKLVKEAYERKKKDVRVSHILIAAPRGSDDTTAVYRKIDSIYKSIQAGADFDNIAKAISEDKQSGKNGGDVGYFTALQLVYPFETVAYNTPVGSVSKPFKTVYGYHIIKKTGERAARGDIQVAQILVAVQTSKGAEGEAAAKSRIDSLYTQLKKGVNFEKLVDEYSEDKFSKNTKGTLPTFGVGQMVTEFEDAAFALKNPGEISTPIKTKFGYHIIKLIKKTPLQPFDTVKTEMSKRIEKDGRIDIARQQFTENLKKKLHYKETPEALTKLINAIPDSTLTNGSFKASTYKNMNANLFEMDGGTVFTQADFANYIENYTKGKIYGGKESTLRSLFKNYTDKALYDYQENKLIDENEEYRNLLTEYQDGIMLFELTDKSVWSKASVDTNGLKNYYENNKSKYMWPPAIKAELFRAINEDAAKKVIKELNSTPAKSQDEIAKAVNGDGVQDKVVYESGKFEKSKFPAGTSFVAGKYSPYYKNEDGSYGIINVKEVYDQPTQKTLSEARGYVISDYQEYLEKQWIQNLESSYPLKINETALKSMVKK